MMMITMKKKIEQSSEKKEHLLSLCAAVDIGRCWLWPAHWMSLTKTKKKKTKNWRLPPVDNVRGICIGLSTNGIGICAQCWRTMNNLTGGHCCCCCFLAAAAAGQATRAIRELAKQPQTRTTWKAKNYRCCCCCWPKALDCCWPVRADLRQTSGTCKG